MLRLLCFGNPRIERPDGRDVEEFRRHPKRFAVLIYLACHSGVPVCQRESLLPVFWPRADESHARNSLRQTLHVLRSILGNGIVQSRNGGEVRLDNVKLTSDVCLFSEARREGRLADALALRTEPFLNDFFVPDAPPFMDWMDQRRRSLDEEAVSAATRLARKADADRDLYQAISWGHRALELSPYDEGVMANLVWALARSGNRGAAQVVYGRFLERMMGDLELEPSLTTRVSVGHALRIPGTATPGGDARPLRTLPSRTATGFYPNL